LHLFETLTRHIDDPVLPKQAEGDWIHKAFFGAIIFDEKKSCNYYKYDIKSAYPSIMDSKFCFPVKEGEFKCVSLAEFNALSFFPYGIYRCKIDYDPTYKKLFRFNDHNHYTHVDLTRAKELNIPMTIIEDGQANFLHYSRDKLLTGSEIFGPYIKFCFDLKQRKAPRAKQILNILWGSLCQKWTKKVISANDDMYDIPETTKLHGIKPYNNDKTNLK